MSGTSVQERKSNAANPLSKLCRMLASMSRRWPRTSLWSTTEGFGVSRIDGSYLRIVYNGPWTDEDMRDCLALFAVWLVADPARLRPREQPLAGVIATVERALAHLNGQRDLPGMPLDSLSE